MKLSKKIKAVENTLKFWIDAYQNPDKIKKKEESKYFKLIIGYRCQCGLCEIYVHNKGQYKCPLETKYGECVTYDRIQKFTVYDHWIDTDDSYRRKICAAYIASKCRRYLKKLRGEKRNGTNAYFINYLL